MGLKAVPDFFRVEQGRITKISCFLCYIFPRYLVNDFTKRASPFPDTPILEPVFRRHDAGV